MRPALPLVTLLVAGLSACSGSSGDSARPLTTVVPTSAPIGESTTSSSPPVPSTTTAAAVSGPERCGASTLQVGYLEGRAALGHALAVFSVRNTSARPCQLTGYPGAELVDASGRVLARAERRPGSILAEGGPRPVTVAAGGAAYFGLESLNVCPDGDPVAESDRVRVTLPDETTAVAVKATVAVCASPEILVSPVRASPDELAGS
ncbi:MAG TPA: DUF4232 domain-containing protein [Acidimicrobiales bacterium]|nr:DUF4232 domain-containing protein [Acidimicrobiales bacterium]